MNTAYFFLDWLAKGSLVLALVWAMNFWVLRRHSAALRHAFWLTGLVLVALLPTLGKIVPPVSLEVSAPIESRAASAEIGAKPEIRAEVPGLAAKDSSPAVRPVVPWAVLFAVVGLTGTVFFLTRLGIAHARLGSLLGRVPFPRTLAFPKRKNSRDGIWG